MSILRKKSAADNHSHEQLRLWLWAHRFESPVSDLIRKGSEDRAAGDCGPSQVLANVEVHQVLVVFGTGVVGDLCLYKQPTDMDIA